MLNVVLVEPEIPQNTGNISRTCAAVGADLHLVKPLGFSTDDRWLKRAGLDYWDKLNVFYYDSFDEFIEQKRGCELFYFTTKAVKSHWQTCYSDSCYLVFGKETAGLSDKILGLSPERCFRIPMKSHIRSLNLSNAVAIAVYEVLRQRGFEGF